MTYRCIRMAMSVDLSPPVVFSEPEELENAISSELLICFSKQVIENGLAPTNDPTIKAALISFDGEPLWLSEGLTKPLAISSILSANSATEAQFRLFSHPIKLSGAFYYLAPVFNEHRSVIAIVAFVSQTVDSAILLALVHSISREINEKIKHHLYLQRLVFDSQTNTSPRELNIQEVEKAAILEAAKVCQGKIQEMHQVLNMGRTTLWRKLKQYGINIKEYK